MPIHFVALVASRQIEKISSGVFTTGLKKQHVQKFSLHLSNKNKHSPGYALPVSMSFPRTNAGYR